MRQVDEMEQIFFNGHSHLEVICGPMFSGKTEELIRRIRRVEYARQRATVFKPQIDTRFDKELVVSHSLQKINSIPVKDSAHIRRILSDTPEKPKVIGLDEVQFFDADVVNLCEELVSAGTRVVVAGLCEDYLGQPFGPMPMLLTHADSVTKLWAVCMRCGAPASKSQRIHVQENINEQDQVLVGGEQNYEARCRACYQRSIVVRS
jgi:thymidine kinase